MVVGLASVMPAQIPMGRLMSMRLMKDEVSMCHTALASLRGANMPAAGGLQQEHGKGWQGGG
jgi:hypothetical protein